MASSYTTNKSLEKPANGDYVNTWNVPVNGDMDVIDQAFGGTTSLNATSGSATLTATQYRSLILAVSGAMSANVIYTIPSGVGGQWIVRNTTTDGTGGPWTITFVSGGGGTTITVDRTTSALIFSDGTNIRSFSTGVPGSNTQVIYNSSGSFAASAALTWDGTTLSAATIYSPSTITANTNLVANGSISTANNVSAGGTINATGAITSAAAVTAFSDRSLKRDIQTIEHAIDLVKRMRGVSYEMINTGALGIGVIAQEMQEVVPQVVLDNNGILSVAYGNLVGVLIEAVKEMSARIDELEQKTPAG